MFDNREEVLEWLHNNEEYVRHHDPSNGVEDTLVNLLIANAQSENYARMVMENYLLPF